VGVADEASGTPIGQRKFRHLRECFGCGSDSPRGLGLHVEIIPDGTRCVARFGASHQGAPGLVHGGLLVTLLDEVMGSLPFDDNSVRVTSTMAVRFLRPVAIDRDLEATATIGEQHPRRVDVTGTVRYLDDPVVRAEIKAEYVIIGDVRSLRVQ
jgi:uncharacterized protein (TIGR00369 family)